jgi:DNA mismatch repair protein MutH
MQNPPSTIAQLQQRAAEIAGKTLGELAQSYRAKIPQDLRVQKGWQGQFIEHCLGADAGNESRPDFSLLDIELKTLPIDLQGKVQESTYVCVVDLANNLGAQWRQSSVYQKLKHVLWVPIAQQTGTPITQSIIGTPFLWQMNAEQESQIKSDWEDAMELISMGKVHQLNAKFGDVLQVRPKAANSRVLTQVVDEKGNSAQTLPRGFYLRAKFTESLLHSHLRV